LDRILITGAAGSIGSALARKLVSERLYLFDNNETGLFEIYEELKDKGKVEYVLGSIRDRNKLDKIFEKYRPEIVYHAAAYKHVALLEKWPDEAIKTNIDGTKNLIEVSKKYNVKKFIFISSDKAVNPKSIMGKTKRECEKMCLEANGKTKFKIVRFGNIMSSRGSIIPIWQRQIRENQFLTITSKRMKRYFMSIPEAAELVIKSSKTGRGGEIFILDMGKEILIKDLADIMIKISGKDIGVKYTGADKGEKFSEQLMSAEERSRAVKKDKLYIIYAKKKSKKKGNESKN